VATLAKLGAFLKVKRISIGFLMAVAIVPAPPLLLRFTPIIQRRCRVQCNVSSQLQVVALRASGTRRWVQELWQQVATHAKLGAFVKVKHISIGFLMAVAIVPSLGLELRSIPRIQRRCLVQCNVARRRRWSIIR